MKKKIFLWLLVILWMGLIFYFSSKDSIESTNQSQGIINKTNIVEISKSENKEETLESMDRVLRKVAHTIEYFVLAVLVCLALKEYDLNVFNIVLIAFIMCFIYSCTDELHQIYVPGRSGEIKDIFIDNIGCTVAYIIFYWRYYGKRSSQNEFN